LFGFYHEGALRSVAIFDTNVQQPALTNRGPGAVENFDKIHILAEF